MKKIFFFALLVSLQLFAFSACYKAPSANTPRSSTSNTPSTTPVVDNSPAASPSSQTRLPTPITTPSFEQALADYRAQNYEKAESAFLQIVSAEPNNADAHYYLGNIYYNRKNYGAAAPHFEQAARIDYKSVEKLMALGENQRALKQFDRAIVQYQKVLGFEPNNANAYYALGLTYVGLNNKIAARQQLQKLEPLNKPLAEQLSKEIDALK